MTDEQKALVPVSPEAIFSAPLMQSDSATAENKSARVPYVGFRGEKTKDEAGALTEAGIKVSDFYLMDVEPIGIKPFGIHLLPGLMRLYTHQDNKGTVDEVSYEPGNGLREHLYGVVAVALPGGPGQPSSFVPALINLRSGQAAALKKTLDLMGTASDPVLWSKRSAAHAKSAKVVFPGGRFRTYITSSVEALSDGSGDFNLGNSVVSPTPEIDVNALNEWVTRDFARIQYVVTAHHKRLSELKELIG